ncbi:hypothetical protein AB0B39_11125 [Micromonospora sp. NPDC049114]|uniref:hypothetical protein n=1 Tax=unclassified Micromonospora TaxID=2617518 RepID=UPI0033CDE7C3
MASRLRGLARRLVLLAAAVGAGFLLAALFQGPAAADGIHGDHGDEPHGQLRVLVAPIARLTVTERAAGERPRVTRADEPRQDRPRAPLAGAIGNVVTPRDGTPSTPPRRSTAASPRSVPLPRVGAAAPTEAGERARLRPASPASTAHRPVRQGHPSRSGAHPAALPVPAAAEAHALPVTAGSLAVGLIATPLPHAVTIVRAVPIQFVIVALLRVTDAVLPPALRAVIPPATPPLTAPPPPGPATTPMTGSPPAAAVPTPPARSLMSPVRAAPLTVCVEAAPPPAAPPMSVAVPTHPTASTGHLAARQAPLAVTGYLPGQPVAPVDQEAAGVDYGSTAGPGLIRPVDRQSPLASEAPRDRVPLLVESRAPSAIARPG